MNSKGERKMRCPFRECTKETTLPMESATHLIVAIGEDNRTYIHGPVFDPKQKPLVMRMLVEVARLVDIDLQELVNKEKEFYEDQREITWQQ